MKVSIAMIVRDEAHMVGGFLEAVTGLWDELVVVDTGSTDDTRERFRAAGARLFEFPWRQDFAAARNESLRHVTGDVVLVLDADERPDEGFAAELRARFGDAQTGAALVRLVNQLPYGHRRESAQLRAWRHDPAVRFRHAIHEEASTDVSAMLQRTGRALVRLEAAVDHLGYVRDRAAARGKKDRDVELLHTCLQRDPSDFYSRLKLLELARYWHDDALWRREAQACTDALELSGRHAIGREPWGPELVALLAEGLFPPSSPAGLAFLEGWAARLPPAASLLHRRGVFLEHQGRLDEARRDFEACLEAPDATGDSQLTTVRPRLGLARLALLRAEIPEALRLAERALAASPRDPEALMAVANLLRVVHGPASLDVWEAAHAARIPACPERDWAMGEALYAGGDYKRAIACFRAASGVPPGGPGALRLAHALLATGQFKASEALARQLVEHQPEAGLGILLFDLADGRDTTLELELTHEAANVAMKAWVDALIASRQRSFVRKVKSRVAAVSELFPWLGGYLLKKTA